MKPLEIIWLENPSHLPDDSIVGVIAWNSAQFIDDDIEYVRADIARRDYGELVIKSIAMQTVIMDLAEKIGIPEDNLVEILKMAEKNVIATKP